MGAYNVMAILCPFVFWSITSNSFAEEHGWPREVIRTGKKEQKRSERGREGSEEKYEEQ